MCVSFRFCLFIVSNVVTYKPYITMGPLSSHETFEVVDDVSNFLQFCSFFPRCQACDILRHLNLAYFIYLLLVFENAEWQGKKAIV